MFDAQWDLKGYEAVLKRMKGIEVGVRQKAGRSAAGTAMRIVTRAAKSNALRIDDEETGRKIADNIVQRLRTRYMKRTGDIMVSVGVATERGRIPRGNPDTGPKGNTPHWHLIELGTKTASAEPFLRPALAQNIGNVEAKFAEALSKQIDKLAAKG